MSFLDGYDGSGDLRGQSVIAGKWAGGLWELGNITSLTATVTADRNDMISRRRDTPDQVIGGKLKRKPVEIDLKGQTYDANNWHLMLLGTTTQFASGLIVDEPHTVGVLDLWVPFGDNRAMPRHALTALTDEAGTTNYVAVQIMSTVNKMGQ